MRKHRSLLFMLLPLLLNTRAFALDADTLKPPHMPHHYFSNMIYLDVYAPGKRMLDTVNTVSGRLGAYRFSQSSLGFNIPVVTKDIYNKDSTRVSNFHFFFTGNYTVIRLRFDGIHEHDLSKTSIGFRGIYNNGKRSIFFIEVSPFVTKDNGYNYTKMYRLASTVLYDYAASSRFGLRFGFTRSFMWGNRFHLPYVGIRIGKLDRINFSMQFPRAVTLNVPIGRYIRTSLYTRSQGGLYSFANTDSIQVGNIYQNRKLYFGRSEFISGLRVDVIPSRFFSFYLSGGLTTKNYIAFYPSAKAKSTLTLYNDYYREDVKPGGFLNLGLVFRFGRTRSYYSNQQLYNTIDLNNTIDPGDNGLRPGNSNIPSPSSKTKKVGVEEVIDLIETQDMY